MDDNNVIIDPDIVIIGQKGGSSSPPAPYVPTEASNNPGANTYVKMLDLLSEGEIGGPAINNSWEQSTYFNDIPVYNGSDWNFNGVSIVGNNGTTTQDYLNGFDEISSTTGVQVPVTVAGGEVTRTITDSEVDSAKLSISIPKMLAQTDKGDITKTTLTFKVSITPDNGAGSKTTYTLSLYAKYNAEYRKQYLIENLLQYGSSPWVIGVERVTPDSGTVKVVNAFSWYSLTEIIDTKLRYYERAVVGITLNAAQFGTEIPNRSYRVNGRKIKIPDNYDPVTRTYTGDWGGSFTVATTNNPAWIVYDLLTDPDVGLGQVISESQVDKWTLYTCGAYCDQDVTVVDRVKQSDGSYSDSTSSEARFSFDGVIEDRTQALEVITHLCSVMRAYPTWADGQITFVQDRPITTPARPVGLSNVHKDGFEYQGVPKRDRHNVVRGSYNEHELFGKLDTVEVKDDASINEFGYNEMDFACFGCKSRTEAIRRCNYTLDTDANTREIVKFKGGPSFADCRPGELLSIQDPNYASTVLEGRVLDSTSNTTTQLVLDKDIVIESGVTYTMLVEISDGQAEERELTNSTETTNILTWTTPLSEIPFAGAQLVLSASNLATRQFIVINVEEDPVSLTYDITGTEYDEDKYARIEDGVINISLPTTGLEPNELTPPTGIEVEAYTYVEGDQELRLFGIQIGWIHSTDPRADQYEIRVRPTTGGFVQLGTTVDNSYDWRPVIGDTYDIDVRAIGVGITSDWLSYTDFVLSDALTNLAPPTNVDTKDGSGVWSGRDCTITWTPSAGSEYASDYDDDVGDSNVDGYKVEVRKPDTTLLRTFQTSKDATEYTYFYNENVEDNSGVPLRGLLFYVYAVDVFGQASSTYDSTVANNPAPDMSSTTPVITDRYGYLRVSWTLSSDNDMSHYKVYMDTNATPTTEVGIVNHPDNTIDVNGLDYGTDYFCQIEPYDLFGVGTKSVIPAAGNTLKIPSINLDSELVGTITMTDSDSNTPTTLNKLYNGLFSSDGVAYTLSGTDKYIQYQYGIDDYFDRISIWTADANANCYVAYSTDGSTWSYLKAEADHTLDSNLSLLAASNQADAQTNYWDLDTVGQNVALFPNNVVASYVRFYMIGTFSTTIYELVPARILVSELAAIHDLSAYSANIGLITTGIIRSSNYPTSGLEIDIDDGTITGEVTFKAGSTGYSNISDAPSDLSELDSTQDTKLNGIDAGADVTADNTAANITGQGDLATKNTVGLTDCDTTLISGGKITTNLVNSNSIVANSITGGDIAASTITASEIGTNEIITNTANIGTAKVNTLHLVGNTVSNDAVYSSQTSQSINSWTYGTYYNCFTLDYVTSSSQTEYNLIFHGMVNGDISISGDYNYSNYNLGLVFRWRIYNVSTTTYIWTYSDNIGLQAYYGWTGSSAFHTWKDSGGNFAHGITSGWTAGQTVRLYCQAARIQPSSPPTTSVTGSISTRFGQITGLKR